MTSPLMYDVEATRRAWNTEYGARAIGSGADHAEALISALFDDVLRLKSERQIATSTEHERHAGEFLGVMDMLMIEMIRERPDGVFGLRGQLARKLTSLLSEARHLGYAEGRNEVCHKLRQIPGVLKSMTEAAENED